MDAERDGNAIRKLVQTDVHHGAGFQRTPDNKMVQWRGETTGRRRDTHDLSLLYKHKRNIDMTR
jgi:hypothetical protein